MRKDKASQGGSAVRSVLFNVTGRGCSFLISFVLTPLIVHGLGSEAYGVWAIVMAVGGYYALADFGLQGASVKYIAEFHARQDRDGLGRLLATSLTMYSALAAVVLAVGGLVAWAFPHLFAFVEQSDSAVRWTVFLTAGTVAVQLQGQVFKAAIKALNRFDVSNVVSISSQLTNAVLMVGAIRLGYGLVGMAAAGLAVAAVTRVTEAFIVTRLLGGVRVVPGAFDREPFRLLWRFGAWNVVRHGCGKLCTNSGPLVIGYFAGPAAVATYAIANALVSKSHELTQSVTAVVMPVSSRMQATANRDELVKMFVFVPRLLATFGMFVAVTFVFFGRELIRIWVGPDYADSAYPILCILAFAMAADSTSGGVRAILTGTGQVGLVTRVAILKAVATVALSVALVPVLGIAGVAWTLLATNVVFEAIVIPVVGAREYGLSWFIYLRRVVWPAAVAVAPALPTAWLLSSVYTPTNLLEWLVEVGLVGITVLPGFMFGVLEAPMRRTILAYLRNSLGRGHEGPDDVAPAGPERPLSTALSEG